MATAAMKVVNLDQRSDEWHGWRNEGLTASQAAAILNESQYDTPFSVAAEKHGLARKDLSGNPHVRRGVKFEDEACDAACAKLGKFFVPVCAEHGTLSYIRSSFDGVDFVSGEILEIKCPSENKFMQALNRGTPDIDHIYQVHHQMLTRDGDEPGNVNLDVPVAYIWYYPCWEGAKEAGIEPLLFKVQKDSAIINQMLTIYPQFWDMIQAGDMPDPDPDRDVITPANMDGETAVKMEEAARRYIEVHKKVADLKAQLKPFEDEMKGITKEIDELCDGFAVIEAFNLRVSRSTRKGTIDYKEVLSQYAPEVTEEQVESCRKRSTRQIRLTPQKPKK